MRARSKYQMPSSDTHGKGSISRKIPFNRSHRRDSNYGVVPFGGSSIHSRANRKKEKPPPEKPSQTSPPNQCDQGCQLDEDCIKQLEDEAIRLRRFYEKMHACKQGLCCCSSRCPGPNPNFIGQGGRRGYRSPPKNMSNQQYSNFDRRGCGGGGTFGGPPLRSCGCARQPAFTAAYDCPSARPRNDYCNCCYKSRCKTRNFKNRRSCPKLWGCRFVFSSNASTCMDNSTSTPTDVGCNTDQCGAYCSESNSRGRCSPSGQQQGQQPCPCSMYSQPGTYPCNSYMSVMPCTSSMPSCPSNNMPMCQSAMRMCSPGMRRSPSGYGGPCQGPSPCSQSSPCGQQGPPPCASSPCSPGRQICPPPNSNPQPINTTCSPQGPCSACMSCGNTQCPPCTFQGLMGMGAFTAMGLPPICGAGGSPQMGNSMCPPGSRGSSRGGCRSGQRGMTGQGMGQGYGNMGQGMSSGMGQGCMDSSGYGMMGQGQGQMQGQDPNGGMGMMCTLEQILPILLMQQMRRGPFANQDAAGLSPGGTPGFMMPPMQSEAEKAAASQEEKDAICARIMNLCAVKRDICSDPAQRCMLGITQTDCDEWNLECDDVRELCGAKELPMPTCEDKDKKADDTKKSTSIKEIKSTESEAVATPKRSKTKAKSKESGTSVKKKKGRKK